MKFGQHLSKYMVAEWHSQYVPYEELKDQIETILHVQPTHLKLPTALQFELDSEHVEELRVLEESHKGIIKTKALEWFEKILDASLHKANAFFVKQVESARQRLSDLRQQVDAVEQTERGDQGLRLRRHTGAYRIFRGAQVTTKHLKSQLSSAFEEYYRHLDMLKSFRDLNVTAVRKIMKKFDKNLGTTKLDEVMARVEAMPFVTETTLDDLVLETESLFTERIQSGERSVAMRLLKVPKPYLQPMDWQTMRIGFHVGVMMFTLTTLALFYYFAPEDRGRSEFEASLQIYRLLYLPVLLALLVSVNIYWWMFHKVNYPFIFGLNARNYLTYRDLFDVAGTLSTFWCLSTLLYAFHKSTETPEFVGPLSLLGFQALLICLPVNVFYKESRMWLLNEVWRIVRAPFVRVRFADFWLADQMNSLVLVFLDLHFASCFVASGANGRASEQCAGSATVLRAGIACMPAWFRFWQSLRRFKDDGRWHHVHNAYKYATTFLVVIASTLANSIRDGTGTRRDAPFVVLWVIAALTNTLYAYYWDVKIDWGLFRGNNAKHPWLRDKITYPAWTYYCAMVYNLVTRFSFVIGISVGFYGDFHTQGLLFILAVVEISRRFVWNFLRLENEHMNNVGMFRATKTIPSIYEHLVSEEVAFGEREFGANPRTAVSIANDPDLD